MRICVNCWKQECSCGQNLYENIDDDIVDDIILLNKKGYKTLYCCQGHKEKGFFDMYVMFKAPLNKHIKPPKDFRIEEYGKLIRRLILTGITDKKINKTRLAFKKWVHDLPNVSV